MLIGELAREELARRLGDEGVHLVTGAFTVHLHIDWPRLVDEFARMYADYELQDPPGIDDAWVRVAPVSRLRRYFRPLVQAWGDGESLIEPVPAERAFTALESCLNWSVATSDVAPIIMHAAALERHGRAMIIPAPSGSGKSTLTAALAWRGWRLFSDEMVVFDFEDFALCPNPRPVSLKNESIALIRAFEPRAEFSPVYTGTHKGDVAYMRPPAAAVARARVTAPPSMVLVPSYERGAKASLRPMSRTDAFFWLADSTVNYASMLRTGFDLLTRIVETCDLYTLTYSDLDEAVALLDRLSDEAADGARRTDPTRSPRDLVAGDPA